MSKVLCEVKYAPTIVVDTALLYKADDDSVFVNVDYVIKTLFGENLDEGEVLLLELALEAKVDNITYINLYC